jgi:hypothetical protein
VPRSEGFVTKRIVASGAAALVAAAVLPAAPPRRVPGSSEAAALDRPYGYQNNPWRGANVAPMAANVEWDLYAGTSHGRTEYLVRMLYNEKETAFAQACKPISKRSSFYDLDELKRCFGKA